MEQILRLYASPFDPRYPVICFDERPCFLLGDVVDVQAMQAGRAAREHYAYTKNGSCALFGALEPLTGTRIANVYEQRTKKEYAQFMKELAASYPEAVKIRVVQDNLNTHNEYAQREFFL